MSDYKTKLKQRINHLKMLWKISEASKISRRYFIISFFDGVSTSLGIILGYFTSQRNAPTSYLVLTVLFTALSVGISGFTGSVLIEYTERQKSINKMRKVLEISRKEEIKRLQNLKRYSEEKIQKLFRKIKKIYKKNERTDITNPKLQKSLQLSSKSDVELRQIQEEPVSQKYIPVESKCREEDLTESGIKERKKNVVRAQGNSTSNKKLGSFFPSRGEINPLVEEAHNFATVLSAIINGAAQAVGSIICVIPFALWPKMYLSFTPFIISFALTGGILFGLGAYFAKISKESKIKFGLILVFSASLTAGLSLLIGSK